MIFYVLFEARKKYDQLNKGHNGIRPMLDRMRKKNEIEYMVRERTRKRNKKQNEESMPQNVREERKK